MWLSCAATGGPGRPPQLARIRGWLVYGTGDAVYLCGFRGAGCQRDCKEFAVIGNPAEVEYFDINRVMTWFVVFANRERTWDGLVANGANHGTFFLVTDTLVKLIEDAPAARAGRAPTEKGKTKWK